MGLLPRPFLMDSTSLLRLAPAPDSGRLVVLARLKRLAVLAARFPQNSSNSRWPPSTDTPATKCPRRMQAARRRPGGNPGHPQVLLAPPVTISRVPEGGAGGQRGRVDLIPSHTHQVLALPVMRPAVTHWLLPQGQCPACGILCTASLPAEQMRGDGPRRTSFLGEMAGSVGASRRAVPNLGASVGGIPRSQGAIQQRVARVSQVIIPYDAVMGQVARNAAGNYLDETSWLVHGARYGLWVRATPAVADFYIPPSRSKAAFVRLMADWTGILVSAGSLVSQRWQGLRQSCLAHLIRTAKGLAEHWEAGIAGFGQRLHRELPRRCQMGTARPTVGQGRAWEAPRRFLLSKNVSLDVQSLPTRSSASC